MAIHEGMLEDAARHFVALPSRPGGYFRVSHVDQLTDFEREVREALFEKFPEVAQKIAAMQECRSWGTKHPGEKLPTDMKERLFPILYNSSWRSGHRVVGRGPGGGRKVNLKGE